MSDDIIEDLELQQLADQQRRARANRPGLPAIDYRIGTHASFLERMLERLHLQTVPADAGSADPAPRRPLEALHARDADDPAVALLDAWASVADVLTFYQERIANENYLRTAVERGSVVELARLIGYEPDPGVAASARLAFEVDDTPQGPTQAKVPRGTQVQSVPQKGELPQTFETGADLVARPQWNNIGARLDRPQYLALDGDGDLFMVDSDGTLQTSATTQEGGTSRPLGELYFVGPDLPLPPPDQRPDDLAGAHVRVAAVNIVHIDGVHHDLRRGDPIVLVGTRLGALGGDTSEGDASEMVRAKRIVQVTARPELGRTDVRVEKYGRAQNGQVPGMKTVQRAVFADMAARVRVRPDHRFAPARAQGADDIFVAQRPRTELQVKQALGPMALEEVAQVVDWQLAESIVPPAGSKRGVVAFARRVGFFGGNAPSYKAVASAYEDNPFKKNWDTHEYTIWQQYSAEGDPQDYPPKKSGQVYLERVVDDVELEDLVVVTDGNARHVYRVGDVSERSVTGFSLSARVTGLQLESTPGSGSDASDDFGVRSTTAFVGNRSLSLARVPLSDELGRLGDEQTVDGATSLTLDALYMGFVPGQEIIIGGQTLGSGGVVDHEVARLAKVVHLGAHTTVRFDAPLQHAYRRASVVVHANVAAATHGESIAEVLGSGDAAQANQSFVLSKPPLTYVPTRAGTGSASTLEIRVDGVLWPQVDSLDELGAADAGYVVHVDEAGKTRVTFGDGEHGARLASGRENVVATYRSGIGLVGEVGRGRLTLLKKRPAGIRSVTNPVAAGGAADPESREHTRQNAPRSTRLLGRVVSLRDYADFARNFPGVANARAQVISFGGRTSVYVTVGGSSARSDELTTQRLRDLARAIAEASSPRYGVEVRNLRPARFGVQARIGVDGRYVAQQVLAAARARLEERYGYGARGFSEPVSSADVIATIQAVEGVEAVYLDALYDVTGAKSLAVALVARPAHISPQAGRVLAAELLFIEPDAIELSEA